MSRIRSQAGFSLFRFILVLSLLSVAGVGALILYARSMDPAVIQSRAQAILTDPRVARLLPEGVLPENFQAGLKSLTDKNASPDPRCKDWPAGTDCPYGKGAQQPEPSATKAPEIHQEPSGSWGN